MSLQVIKDGFGNSTGIFIPISDWELITQRHEDLKLLVPGEIAPRRKLQMNRMATQCLLEGGTSYAATIVNCC